MHFKNIISSLIATLLLNGCGGDGGVQGNFISYDNIIVSGQVVKGPVSGSTVTIINPDTNETLGTATTDSEGKYSIDVKNYEGILKVSANGGSYTDEIDNSNQDASTMTLEAISTQDANTTIKQVVNITPYTTIASKLMKNYTFENVNSKNKEVAKLLMDSDFDVTKVAPKNFAVDTIDANSSEGKYSIYLAAFAKVSQSQATNVDANISDFVDDLNDSIAGVSALALQNALADVAITSKVDANATQVINNSMKKIISLQKVFDYANNNTSPTPELNDYIDMGFTQISSIDLDDLNTKINALEGSDVDTFEKITPIITKIIDRPTIVITPLVTGVVTGDVTYMFTFSSDVSGFTSSDIDVSGGTKGDFTSVSAKEYNLLITPDANSTTPIVVSIDSGSVISEDNEYGNKTATHTQDVNTTN